MDRSQLLGLAFLVMGLGHGGVAARSVLASGTSVIGLGYLLASATIVALALVSIYRPAWIDNEELARQSVTRTDLQLVAVTVVALSASVVVGYSFTGWLP
ncbi:hypothetical protein BRC77_09035 [Halobacteriales archaeon QH_8_64_26]|jgi:hypothetical protein|nr:MAG: hypothetical protein BRC77_09035 [Halobacteriales archaeon QH_8_64_26]